MTKLSCILFAGALMLSKQIYANTIVAKGDHNGETYQLEKVLEGHGIIWGIAFIDANEMLFTERKGKLYHFNITTGTAREIKHPLNVSSGFQGGLLDIHLHPDFANNSTLYISYSKKIGSRETTALVMAQLVGEELKSVKEIFLAKPYQATRHHFGSRIATDGRGHLFLSIGDRGRRNMAQQLDKHMGKIVRLNLDGSVPADNPFVNQAGALPEIWSYGHRNTQGLYYDHQTNKLYNNEHGPRGGDEINLIEAGKNYGWPVITYGREYSGRQVGQGITHKAGMEQPLKYFVPSIAPSGLTIYRGSALPAFNEAFVSGALALKHVNINKLGTTAAKNCEVRLAEVLNERVRNVVTSPDKQLYFSTDHGKIYRIIPGVN